MPAADLRRQVAPFVPDGEELIGAFPTRTGASYGADALLGTLGWLGVLIALVRSAGKPRPADHVLVVTDRSIVVCRDDGRMHPSWEERRVTPTSRLEPLSGSGDHWVTLQQERHWVALNWIDEVRRIERALGRH